VGYSIKHIKGRGGRVRYQAQVWHDSLFYGAKTFDNEGLATTWGEAKFEAAVAGTLQPAALRAKQRKCEVGLNQTMAHWAQQYLEGPGQKHGESRRYDYALVGKLLSTTKLRAFDGEEGAQLVEQLSIDWQFDRRQKSKATKPTGESPKPLVSNTVRLRLSALLRIIRFAKSKLPVEAGFRGPALEAIFEWELPAAYSAPRTRLPSDDEYASMMRELGLETPLGDLLMGIDETGARMSELRTIKGADVRLLEIGGVVIGGEWTLRKHKTQRTVGTRQVPLSLFAAQMLQRRRAVHGDGPLFPGLTKDQACDGFDEACDTLGIQNLQYKDFRRAFINRNKDSTSHLDMVRVTSAMLEREATRLTEAERSVLQAVGHRRPATTLGYTLADIEKLCARFTATSRWPRIRAMLAMDAAPTPPMAASSSDELDALQSELAAVLAKVSAAMRSAPRASSASPSSPT